METLAFIHNAVAYEDPSPDSELRSFDNLSAASGSIALGLLSASVVTATLSHADQAQALIRRGDTGSSVRQLQSKLGIYADGVFGVQTYNSLIAFQQRNRLLADGIAGSQTLPVLGLPPDLGSSNNSGSNPNIGGSSLVTARIGLQVRNSPNGYSIGTLPYLSRVTRTGSTVPRGGYNWTQIKGGGWVASEYLDYGSGSNETIVPAGPFADVRSSLLVRNSPAGYVISSIGAGRSLKLAGATQYAAGRSWSQLASGGWVASDYIGYR